MIKIAEQKVFKRDILKGINILADTVKVTIGPCGRNVLMHQKANVQGAEYSDDASGNAPVMIINDGAAIADSIVLADPLQNMGAQIVKDACSRMNKEAGDGTTTVIVLIQALLQEGFRYIAAGMNPVFLRRGMNKALDVVLKNLEMQAVPVCSQEDMVQVAAISCQSRELGKMIGKTMYEIGADGVVHVEDSKRLETFAEITTGIVFDRGIHDPYMATDEASMTAELYDPYILFYDSKISSRQDIIPVLMLAAEDERALLIVSDGVEGDALGIVAQNRIEGDMDIVCVRAPMYGEGRRWRMEDMALQTGAVYVTEEMGMNIRQVNREMLGSAKQVRVTKDRTSIIEPAGDPQKIQERIKELRYYADHTDYEFNAQRHKERLASFVSGIASIYVGGMTQVEQLERKMRIEDAVYAVSAARKEGVVPGGGIALLNTISALSELKNCLEEEEKLGVDIVMHALEAPVRQIAENSGENGRTVVAQLKQKENGIGYNAETNEFINMKEAGILDPLVVTKSAVQIAVSSAGTLLTSEAGTILQNKEK